jgi:hypothetical protein
MRCSASCGKGMCEMSQFELSNQNCYGDFTIGVFWEERTSWCPPYATINFCMPALYRLVTAKPSVTWTDLHVVRGSPRPLVH